MDMKIGIVLMTLIIMVPGVFAQGTGVITDNHKIIVTFLSQDPDPVEPGQIIDVRFKFENYGLGEARNVDVEILPDTPFSLYTGDKMQSIGTLTGRQITVDGAVIKYSLRVDSDAIEGANDFTLRYRIDNGPWQKLEPYTINVERQQSILSVERVESVPELVSPGSESTLRLVMENLAGTDFKDVRVTLGLVTMIASTTSVTTIELPFSPVGSTNEKILDSIQAGKQGIVEFNLMTDADAVAKVYKVPVTISYTDMKGSNYTIQQYMSLVVGDTPDISVTLDSSDFVKAPQKGTANIKVVNKGLSEIKFVEVFLEEKDTFDLLSSSEVYIGNIDSDDYETAEFDIYVKDCEDCDIILPLTIRYMDVTNKAYEEQVNIEVPLFTDTQVEELGLEKKSPVVGIIIVVVIVVVGVFLYRRWRRKKKH